MKTEAQHKLKKCSIETLRNSPDLKTVSAEEYKLIGREIMQKCRAGERMELFYRLKSMLSSHTSKIKKRLAQKHIFADFKEAPADKIARENHIRRGMRDSHGKHSRQKT